MGKALAQHIAPVAARIKALVEGQPGLSRSGLARTVCQWLGLRDATGRLREMTCRASLVKLHRQGIIPLPAPKRQLPEVSGRPPVGSFTPPALCCTLAELGGVELVAVDAGSPELSRLWRQMLDAHHYLGSGPLCGAQLRYLVKCPSGWLGGLSFSAAAWRLAARDRWIGWDEQTRAKNLALVVGNSRFLILPTVTVPHLASHVLGLACRRLADDWQARYGYRPALVETFVEKERFAGTCYRAANWLFLGETNGRGRQDSTCAKEKPVKNIYVYPLRPDVREALGGKKPEAATVSGDWADEEFGSVHLGDARLSTRLKTIARDFCAKPQANIPQACDSLAKTKAAYRFFDHEATTMNTLLSGHYDATKARCAAHQVVLAVQDTTSLNYQHHPATTGLGPICAKGTLGLLVHDTMAFTTEGAPLGLVDVKCWARPENKEERAALPKESVKWLDSFDAACRLAQACPKTTVVSVGDREADMYELFAAARRNERGPHLLVRSQHNRRLTGRDEYLWNHLDRQPQAGIQELLVPRQKNRPERLARLSIRFAKVELKPPPNITPRTPVSIWAVLATEIEPPPEVEPLEWMLLTTLEVAHFDAACEKLTWYTKRWGIEIYHRTLKSGCKIEERQLGAAERIEACLAIDMVVAWRVYHLAMAGREMPDAPCTVFFEDHEWKALVAYTTRNPAPATRVPTLREAMLMVAALGGFLGRRRDGNPGTKSLWLGLQVLGPVAAMWQIMVNPHPPPS